MAVAHPPTASAFELAAIVCRNVVLDVTSTVSVMVDADAEAEARRMLWTRIVDPDTDSTLPLTRSANPAVPRAPDGKEPDGAPLGRLKPLGGVPEPVRPRPPIVHDPFAADVIVTVCAVMVRPALPDDGALDAVTHSPAFTAARVVFCSSVNFVLPEYLTVVCPVVVFCTSMLFAATAAMVPEVAGAARPPERAPPLGETEAAAAAGVAALDEEPPPPHADRVRVRAAMAAARPRMRSVQRTALARVAAGRLGWLGRRRTPCRSPPRPRSRRQLRARQSRSGWR